MHFSHLITRMLLAFSVATCTITSQADTIIEQRQEAFELIEKDLKSVKKGLKSQPADSPDILQTVQRINKHSRHLLTAFPEAPNGADTRARSRIWKKKDDYDARLQNFNQDIERLVSASKAGDGKELKDALGDMSGHCRGCHLRYRTLW